VPLLSLRNVTKRYGGLVANHAVSFDVDEGALFAIIGPNGAGKTTLFNTISGAVAPTSGDIVFDGDSIVGMPQADIAGRGLIRTYQLVQLFKELTVAENVMVGAHRMTRGGVGAALFRPPWVRRQERDLHEKTKGILDFVGLSARADVLADHLPYGEQRLLEVARALAAAPRLLLLDEPAAGLNTGETEALAYMIQRVNGRGITVMLIEHDMGLVMRIAQRIAVIDFGRKIAEGTADEIRAHPDVITAYLGGAESVDA
jgi:branched-chain amino acid transport system ATP-binding protein